MTTDEYFKLEKQLTQKWLKAIGLFIGTIVFLWIFKECPSTNENTPFLGKCIEGSIISGLLLCFFSAITVAIKIENKKHYLMVLFKNGKNYEETIQELNLIPKRKEQAK